MKTSKISILLVALTSFSSVLAQDKNQIKESKKPITNDSSSVVFMPPPPPPDDPALFFSYDAAGNQTQRFFCYWANSCVIPPPPSSPPPNTDEVAILNESHSDSNKVYLSEALDKNLTIYPNPTRGLVTIKLESNGEVNISKSILVYDALGSLILDVPSFNKPQFSIDLRNRSAGVYFVHIHISNGKSITKKIIKE